MENQLKDINKNKQTKTEPYLAFFIDNVFFKTLNYSSLLLATIQFLSAQAHLTLTHGTLVLCPAASIIVPEPAHHTILCSHSI